MADNDTTGTAPAADSGSPADNAGAPAAAATTPDATYQSRIAGLDAKVTKLIEAQKAAEDRAAAAAQKLADYESGKVQADEALRAQIAAKDAELAQVREEARLNRIEAKYPETFGTLGKAAAALSEDQLAAAEARFAGVEAAASAPVPHGTNAARPPAASPKSLEDMSVPELEAHLRSLGQSGSGW